MLGRLTTGFNTPESLGPRVAASMRARAEPTPGEAGFAQLGSPSGRACNPFLPIAQSLRKPVWPVRSCGTRSFRSEERSHCGGVRRRLRCSSVLMVLVTARGVTCVDLGGLAALEREEA